MINKNSVKKIAVVFSGCGHRDGTEITEAVSCLIGIAQNGAAYQVFAPDTELSEANSLTGESTGEKRSVLNESARICRGKIKPIKELKAKDYDALVFPGGYGAALNLCDWAKVGAKCSVHPEVERVIKEFYSDHKPIGGVCIAPALLARVLGSHGISVTIGEDKDTAAEISKTGAVHENCRVDDFVTDREHRLVTTPAYMYDNATPAEVFSGIQKAMTELVEMA